MEKQKKKRLKYGTQIVYCRQKARLIFIVVAQKQRICLRH